MLKTKWLLALLVLLCCNMLNAQQVKFTEYDLPNGLHVVLSPDSKAPVVTVSVMYHVGSKNEDTARTGFAHFFEHLLFEGSDNIKRGEFMKIVSSNGGQNNANTTQDRTFYYENFPSNNLELGLWLESERMMHPVINEVGVRTQNEVVKEEKRLRIDNSPYGKFIEAIFKNLFKEHPYRWMTIGSMSHLDAAKLEEFQAFNKKYYVPNNAVLVIAGDINLEKTKKLVEDYFSPIPKGTAAIVRPHAEEKPITTEIVDTAYDSNIQIPLVCAAYRTPGETSHDARVLDMVNSILSKGSSSRLYKKMVDDKKNSLQVLAFNYSLEDYGAYIIGALPNNGTPLNDLVKDIDEEIVKLQTDLISETDYQKIINQFENDFVGENTHMQGVADNLANAYTFFHNTNFVNEELAGYKKITSEEIRDVAKKYLNPNQRVLLYYLPTKK